MVDFEKLGVLYLGRAVGADGKTGEDLVLYDSTDLVTHAVCVGMTGSGKTGLCIDLLEEAAIDGVPAILIDPKGDLGNLLLTFPDLAARRLRAVGRPGRRGARRRGRRRVRGAGGGALEARASPSWGQDGERIRRLRAAADFAIYTPGSDAGRPLSVLGSLAPPTDGDDAEGLRDAIASTATGLLALVGIAGDPVQSREHILLATILQDAWTKGQSLDLPTLIARIQDPGTTRVGVLDLESFFPAKDRFGLAMAVNNLLAAPGFDLWLRGEPIDVQAPAVRRGRPAARLDRLHRAPQRLRAHVRRDAAPAGRRRLGAPAVGHDEPARACCTSTRSTASRRRSPSRRRSARC